MEWFPECGDGGLDRYFFEALHGFAESGLKGTALVTSAPPGKHEGIALRGMAEKGASLRRRWAGARAGAGEALRGGVDFANAHFALYAFPWLRLLPPTVPLIVHFHGPWAEEMRAQSRSRWWPVCARWIERAVYLRATRCVVLSNAFRDLLHTHYGVPLERIRVIPGGTHLAGYFEAPTQEAARARLGWPANRRIIFSVRRLARRMGLDLLIEAMVAVRHEFPDALLLIGGKGPERENLQAQIAAAGLTEHVRLLGFVPEVDLPTAYAAADFSVVPTVALEGFGLITVESLASGTPVLGTRVGATPEILAPLDVELLFEEATAAAMVAKMRAVLQNKVKLPDRETCRAYSRQYGWPAVTPRLLAVFEEAMAEKRAVR